ncbi:hypothetical protein ACIGDI_40015 [Streptomyces sp. NPDC085900]|uniref:hypothetical protein n=1 Tax=Streptomyces sp. NPDC085900 TaxID=3365737 RepID=UPI0037D743A5
MTDAFEAAPTIPTGPRDEAVVSYGLYAKRLSDLALELLAHDLDAPPGDRVRRALELGEWLDKLVNQAAVAEREDGASWRAIGEAAGITRQSAAGRWGPAVEAWRANGRRALSGGTGESARTAAVALDLAYARRADDNPRTVFSTTLHVVRYPEREAARARREQADAARQRLHEVRTRTEGLTRAFHTAQNPADRAEALRSRAAIHDEAAGILEQLAALDPEQADAYRASAVQCAREADADREFAALLAPKGLPASTT